MKKNPDRKHKKKKLTKPSPMLSTTHGMSAVLPICAVIVLEFSVKKETGRFGGNVPLNSLIRSGSSDVGKFSLTILFSLHVTVKNNKK